MKGRIHSYETMGLHDGPGIRTVFFLQGCPLKCLYCHNPDSQKYDGGTEMNADEVVAIAKRYKPFYQRSGGGVTISGGEPLLQIGFLQELFPKLRAQGISIALDTSGYGREKSQRQSTKKIDTKEWNDSLNTLNSWEKKASLISEKNNFKTSISALLFYVDHLLMDIKHVEEPEHLKLTGKNMEGIQSLLREIPDFQGKVWVRHVMIPGYTDNHKSMEALHRMIVPYQSRIEKVEILPYHKMGSGKYRELGRKDPLYDTPPMNVDKAREYELFLGELLESNEKRRTG